MTCSIEGYYMKDMVSEEKGTKEQIRDVAIDLFSQKGYDAVSIREIARAVGIRESSIYNHYKGKEDIMDSIFEFFMAELSREDPGELPLEVMLEKYGPEEYMIVSGRAYLQRINQPRIEKIWRLISIDLYRNEKIRTFFRTTMMDFPLQVWEQTFLRMMELGYIKEYDARLLAREFFNYCIYLFFDYFVINYDIQPGESFVEGIMDNLSGHIRFIFEAVRLPEAS